MEGCHFAMGGKGGELVDGLVSWLVRKGGCEGLRLGSLVCVRILLVRESSGARGAIVGDCLLLGSLMVPAVDGIAFFGRRFGGGVERRARGGEEK